MAESKEISKKRKRPSLVATHSLMGIFTRSKSEIHRHRNLSGQSRPDSIRGRNHQDQQLLVKKQKTSSLADDSSPGHDLSSHSIKDLRLRRVFSPSSTDAVIRNCLEDIKNLEKSEVSGNCLRGIKEVCENGDLRKLEMSNEDFGQSTPPDAEIFGGKQEVGRNGSGFSDQFLEKKPSESRQKHDENGFHEERNGINYKTKSVLKPCSRAKLFKTPGSFSYRRLLPYLMDMEKDYSYSSKMGHCQKTEKGLEEKQLLASNSQETLADKSQTTGCSLEGHNSDSGKELNVVSFESLASQESESSLMPLVNGEIQKLELKVSCEDQKNCSKYDSSSTKEVSHFNKKILAGVISSGKMMTGDSEVAKNNVESLCNAQSLEVLDQKLSTVGNNFESCDYDEIRQNSNDDSKQSEIEGTPKATIFHSFEAQHLNSVNPALSEMGGNKKCSVQHRVNNDGRVLEQVRDLDGECMSIAPSDSDMSSKPETDDSRGNRVDRISQGMDHVIDKSTNNTFDRNNGQGGDKNLDSSPKNKLVPNQRLHLKLSKIPGSFSYRRLLPFLIDIRNDYSCASGNDQSQKVEKSSKEKLLSPFFTSGKEICMETFNAKSCPVEHHAGDDTMLSVAAATATRNSSNHQLTRSPPKKVADSPRIMDSQQEQGSLVKQAALDINQKLESTSKNVVEPLVMSSSSLVNSGLFPREEGAKSVSHQLPLETKEDCIKSNVKCTNREKQNEADSFVDVSIPLGIPAAGLKKGILKSNPRGCRGVCTCLNCSSFRLHAERSFEFSRNQMQDAEEVALGLIKELSYLQNMLEKSAFGAKDHTSIFLNQVKEACKKASEAEEIARTRLSEMSDDLNIHCRIPCGQRPSVRFANYVEERVIPIADSSSK